MLIRCEGEAAVQRAREAGDTEARYVRAAWQGMLSLVCPAFRSAPQVSAGDALQALMKEAAQKKGIPACRPCGNATPCRPVAVGRRRESSLQGARCSLPAKSVTFILLQLDACRLVHVCTL